MSSQWNRWPHRSVGARRPRPSRSPVVLSRRRLRCNGSMSWWAGWSRCGRREQHRVGRRRRPGGFSPRPGRSRAAALQVAAQVAVAAVELVGGGPPGWDSGIQSPVQHPPPQRDLRGERGVSRNAGRGAAIDVLGPGHGQVDGPVDQRPPGRGRIGKEHRHLRVLDPAGGSGVLALHPDAVSAGFEVAGVVEDQHRLRMSDRVDDIAAHIVADRVRVPDGLAEQSLHRLR